MSNKAPWMSSLKVQYRFLYLLRMRNALLLAKSSNCMRQFIPYLWRNSVVSLTSALPPHPSFTCAFTYLSVTACMNSSISSSYSFPLILLCFSPMYRGSLSSAWTEERLTGQQINERLKPCMHASASVNYCQIFDEPGFMSCYTSS